MNAGRLLVRAFTLLAVLVAFGAHAAEGDPQPIPKYDKRIIDLTATLSVADEARKPLADCVCCFALPFA